MKAHAQRLIAARLGLALLTLLLVSAIVFAVTGLLPGDAAQQALGQAATAEAVAALRHQFGLDQPALQRYGEW
ncbi:ABC transporter permease, partial [Mesorhizobium sp. M8A.F.Ca.ET.181.01.1.1]